MNERIENELVQHRDAFVAFARKRIADPELAADVVQDSFVKALKAAEHLRDNESIVAWYYRILRRSIIDLYRRRDARERMLERAAKELPLLAENEPEVERAVCACVEKLLPALKRDYANALRAVDLEGRRVDDVAKELGTTPHNLRTRLHRARHKLKSAVLKTCNLCAKHGCVDCTCGENTHAHSGQGATAAAARSSKGPAGS